MTKALKRVTRETETTVRSLGKARSVVVSIESGGMVLGFRLKGLRQTYRLPTHWCFCQAVDAQVRSEMAAKKAARKAARA